jgi:hypothetical protein
MYKCELLVGGYAYDVTDDLSNWDDVKLSFKRDNYDGVIRSFSTKFQFAGSGYSLLKGEYRKAYIDASASIVFYTRNNSWTWNERFRCALDFSTFSDDGSIISINAVDDSLAALIKANKGTQYEYPVDDLKEEKRLLYDRLQMHNQVNYTITGENEVESEVVMHTYVDVPQNSEDYSSTLPLYIVTPDIQNKNVVEVYDEEQNNNIPYSDTTPPAAFFLKCLRTFTTVNIKFDLVVRTFGGRGLSNVILRHYDGTSYKDILRVVIPVNDNYFAMKTPDEGIDIKMANGDMLFFVLTAIGATRFDFAYPVADPRYINISFMGRDETISINVVKPISLLNRLLKSINGGKEGVTCEIASGVDSRLDNTLIVAAESIRGLEKAKIYTSYTKFTKWMEAEFGFVPVINDNKVSFVHRDSLFTDVEIKDLADQWNDFTYSVNASLIYANVKAGYDKQDYDSVNGRDEFRFTNEYTTGHTLTDNVLDLISPYRADAYGIEFLAAKRGEDTTDSDSDNDIFFVGASVIGGEYKLIRGGNYSITGVISPESMFNVMYAPRFMIEANKKYIGVSASLLAFASSNGNSDIVINGVAETEDIPINESDFTIGEVSVETGDVDVPVDLKGYISLTHHGEVYKGYISKSDFNYGKSETVKYILIIKSIE